MATKLAVEQIPTSDLVPYARNAKTHSAEQVKAIAASITQYGFNSPVLLADGNVIIAGHGRVLAAQELALAEVPCIRLAHLTDEQARAYRLLDNRLTEYGTGWDMENLKFELGEINLDLSYAGFEELTVKEPEQGLTDADAVPEPPAEPITKRGDPWILGEHRLLCGDSTNADDVAKLMNDTEWNVLVTSPPYFNQREYSVFSGLHDYMAFIDSVLGAARKASSANAVIAWNCGNGEADREDIASHNSLAIDRAGYKFCDMITWKKSGAVFDCPRSMHIENYRYYPAFAHEQIYIYLAGTMPQFNISDKEYARDNQTNVWEIRQVRTNDEATVGHCAQYPVELPTRCIRLYSSTGAHIFDPFLGSGTTMIAAEQLGRRCYGMEIEPRYVDVAVKRWEEFTGKKATLDQQ